jgi:hypothetical protein
MRQSDTKATESIKTLTPDHLSTLTQTPIRRQETFEFAGYLTNEDENAVYLADPQGTWVIKRTDLVAMEDWKVQGLPEFMSGNGRPVRVSVKDGATIHEIRPWLVRKGELGSEARAALQKVFTLGGAPLPITERSLAGESQMKQLERHFARRVGWSRDYDPARDLSRAPIRASYSHTINIYDGYCDADCGF